MTGAVGAAPRARTPGAGSCPARGTAAVVLAALVVGTVVVLRGLVAVPVRIESASMLPTYGAGDVVLVGRHRPDVAELRRGDVVTFRSPSDGTRALKRVVGLPGEDVVVRDGRLHVDGVIVAEPYVDHRLVDGYYSRTYRVPADAVFVMGDNRGNSVDSRDYGPVRSRDLLGPVLTRLWPVTG